MEIDEALARGVDEFGAAVAAVGEAQWSRPTPCREWTARQVVRHCASVQVRTAAVIRRDEQPSIEAPVEDEQDPAPIWTAAEAGLRAALVGADFDGSVTTSSGPMPIAAAVSFPAVDLFVHAWDLGQASGRKVELADDVVAWINGVMGAVPAEKLRSPRTFGPERPAPPGATPTAALMAFLGRDAIIEGSGRPHAFVGRFSSDQPG